MAVYMVVATFRQGTDMDEVFAVADAERAQVKVLTAEGRMGRSTWPSRRARCSSRYSPTTTRPPRPPS